MNKKRRDFLIYGKAYELFRNGKYIGSALWIDDANIGDSFIEVQPNGDKLIFNEIDEWIFKSEYGKIHTVESVKGTKVIMAKLSKNQSVCWGDGESYHFRLTAL